MSLKTMGDGQVQVIESDILPKATGDDTSKPRMPFKSDLVLTREQEDALVDHALARIDQIEAQMGKQPWNSKGGEYQIASEPDSWMWKREKYTARYYNHVKDRKQPNTLFWDSNLTASLSQRITGQMIAKAVRFFFGEPDDNDWFTADPIGAEDDSLTEKVRNHSRWKAGRCKIKKQFINAITFAGVRGEAVKKIVHQERFQIFEKTEEILVTALGGDPIKNAFDDYIVRADVWTDEMGQVPVSQVPAEQQHLAIVENEGVEGMEPMAVMPTGRAILKKDGVTVRPATPIWEMRKVPRKRITFQGPTADLCYYRDFLAPIDAPGIQPGEADLICHLYDMSVMQVIGMFAAQFAAGEAGVEEIQKAINALSDILKAGPEAKSSKGAPRADFGEKDTEQSPNNPLLQIAETWLTYDANNDGQEEEILLIIDRANKRPIFYEYLSNVTLKGFRPFNVDRVIEVDGRWWGMGWMEYFDPEQEFIDLQINRKNFREGKSGRVTLWNPRNTLEGDRDPNLKLNDGATYTKKPGMKDDDILSYIALPEVGADLMESLQMFVQFMNLKSGAINTADQEASGMPTSDTATGVNEIRESGQELFSMFLVVLYDSISDGLSQVIDVMYSNLNREEVFTYFNGEADEILSLTPDDVRDLTLNVRLSITRQKDRQTLASGAQADALITKFYGQPYILQERTKTYYRNQLKALRVPQADKLIEPLDPMLLAGQPMGPDPGAMVPGSEPVPAGTPV